MPECDNCIYNYVDEDGEETCEVELDEDEYARFLTSHSSSCPYYQGGNEYDRYRREHT